MGTVDQENNDHAGKASDSRSGFIWITLAAIALLLNVALVLPRVLANGMAYATGAVIAIFIIPGVIVLLFSAGGGARDNRSRAKIIFWTLIVTGIGNASQLVGFIRESGGLDPEVRVDKLAEGLARGLPHRLDSMTRVDRVQRTQRGIRFEITLTNDLAEQSGLAGAKLLLRSQRKAACTDTMLQALREAGKELEVAVSDSTGQELYDFRVNTSECGSLMANRNGEYSSQGYSNTDRIRFIAQEINAISPIAIDDMTRLEKAVPLPNAVRMVYSVNDISANDIDREKAKTALARYIVPRICSIPEYRALMARGIDYSMQYLDANGEELTQLNIDRRECEMAGYRR